ncbi:MAG: adenylate/guanylate cyclase domain-containing protein [Bacillati bacterium ANGP1]|uniref:Adenylate/guanylate cyclase domain-containing protein n=1 Tax=Candidatus Segetimicrobium genomatis TaxID=2569760 RepID=A0A537L432_9BACT|nr:MAG: adenylate/guanylate cyclase domain-containing protein [Terrabacteria group bacterium ANGP1]
MHAHGVEFRIRIGVHTGPVAGVIGKGLRNDYTAIGKTTSVAARLLNFARPGHIAISATTRYATERAFGFSDLGSEVVEGNAEALREYAVTRRTTCAAWWRHRPGSTRVRLLERLRPDVRVEGLRVLGVKG